MRKFIIAVAAFAALFALAACEEGPAQQTVESDTDYSWDNGTAVVPTDTRVYVITGQVIGEPESLTRQTSPATISGSMFMSGGFGSGFISGTGPGFSGKGFVRLKVSQSDSLLAPAGSIVILKTTDTKATALMTGDTVEFKCRYDFEAVSPVGTGEKFNQQTHGTPELDLCRLSSPVIGR